jgi:hypothetical protein
MQLPLGPGHIHLVYLRALTLRLPELRLRAPLTNPSPFNQPVV